jgi:hypothetical protein
MRWLIVLAVAFCVVAAPSIADEPPAGATGTPASTIRFRKLVLANKYYCDGIQAGDINRDGHLDVVAGPFWYAGPDFKATQEFYPAEPLVPERSPSNSMFSFVHDFSGDGWPDILVLGRVHLHAAYWYENPGTASDQLWEKHFAFERVRGESPSLVDLDRDGVPQVICHWDGRWGWIEPDAVDPRRPWRFQAIGEADDWPQFYHGEGIADVNGDGRLDLVINDGWYENVGSRVGTDHNTPQVAPSHNTPQVGSPHPTLQWPFHRVKFSAGRGGAQVYGDDADGDGDTDLITALDAHGWGLAWYEHRREGGQPSFVQHTIMGDRSQIDEFGAAFTQPHALDLADIDGDGLRDIIVGKRMWAHGPTGDIEPAAAPVLYWFQLVREPGGGARYVPHLIDDASGVGVQVQAVDVNADGRTDILTASKLGSFVFLNLGGS